MNRRSATFLDLAPGDHAWGGGGGGGGGAWRFFFYSLAFGRYDQLFRGMEFWQRPILDYVGALRSNIGSPQPAMQRVFFSHHGDEVDPVFSFC